MPFSDFTVQIIDGHHRWKAIRDLRQDPTAQLDWTRQHLIVHVTRRVDGTALSALEIVKTSKLLNDVASNDLPFNSFEDTLESLLTYSEGFFELYEVRISDSRINDIREDLQEANFLCSVTSPSSYVRYIRATKLYLRYPGIFAEIKRLNRSDPPVGCTRTVQLGIRHIVDGSLERLPPTDVILSVEGA